MRVFVFVHLTDGLSVYDGWLVGGQTPTKPGKPWPEDMLQKLFRITLTAGDADPTLHYFAEIAEVALNEPEQGPMRLPRLVDHVLMVL